METLKDTACVEQAPKKKKGLLFALIGAAVIVAGLAVYYFTSRCPNCKKFIRDLSSDQEEGAHCKHCGETFEIKD